MALCCHMGCMLDGYRLSLLSRTWDWGQTRPDGPVHMGLIHPKKVTKNCQALGWMCYFSLYIESFFTKFQWFAILKNHPILSNKGFLPTWQFFCLFVQVQGMRGRIKLHLIMADKNICDLWVFSEERTFKTWDFWVLNVLSSEKTHKSQMFLLSLLDDALMNQGVRLAF